MMVKPASAMGGPLLVGRLLVYWLLEEGAMRRIRFEYVAADCHVEVVELEVGHIPPKL